MLSHANSKLYSCIVKLYLYTINFAIMFTGNNTSQMIYHRGGEPERALQAQAMDNSRICHRLLFHKRGKQYFVWPFLLSMKLVENFRRRKISRISEKYNFRRENVCRLLTFAVPKDTTPQNLRRKHAKFAKVFSLESFPLYSKTSTDKASTAVG